MTHCHKSDDEVRLLIRAKNVLTLFLTSMRTRKIAFVTGYYSEAGRALDWLHAKKGGSSFFIFHTPDGQAHDDGDLHPRTDIEDLRQLYADSINHRLPETNK